MPELPDVEVFRRRFQISNVLAFPGVFRGLLDGPFRQVDYVLMAAAADAIASLVEAPGPESVVPDVFDDRLVATVAQAVCDSAHGLSDMTREEPGTEASSDD